MSIFKTYYGKELLQVSPAEWKKLLSSNDKLFKMVSLKRRAVAGPQVRKTGQVMGAAFVAEEMFFGQWATDDQVEFRESDLPAYEKVVPGAVAHYVLTVSSSLPQWKEDIKVLMGVARMLELEDKQLRKEEELVGESTVVAGEVPAVLKKHLPFLSEHIDKTDKGLRNMLNAIKRVEKEVVNEEVVIKTYLNQLQTDWPFLFE